MACYQETITKAWSEKLQGKMSHKSDSALSHSHHFKFFQSISHLMQ